jgi:hypothetical protein
MYEFIKNPRCGEVYNLGGGKLNSCSIWEAFEIAEEVTGKKQRYTYVDQNREGDHICYYSDLRKIQSHFPAWKITRSLRHTVEEIAASWTVLDGPVHSGRESSLIRIYEDSGHRNLRVCGQQSGAGSPGAPGRSRNLRRG